jgi:hypothetical protein
MLALRKMDRSNQRFPQNVGTRVELSHRLVRCHVHYLDYEPRLLRRGKVVRRRALRAGLEGLTRRKCAAQVNATIDLNPKLPNSI